MVLDAIVPLLSLIALEVILGIDNIVFISILSDKLPPEQRSKLRFDAVQHFDLFRAALVGLGQVADRDQVAHWGTSLWVDQDQETFSQRTQRKSQERLAKEGGSGVWRACGS